MGWPQITVIILMSLSLGTTVALHGKPRTPTSFPVAAMAVALHAWLLWAGGFFN